jgi:F0F1-type ATP synthase delta subunit
MTNRTAATRYARALFDVSVQDHDLQRVEIGRAHV